MIRPSSSCGNERARTTVRHSASCSICTVTASTGARSGSSARSTTPRTSRPPRSSSCGANGTPSDLQMGPCFHGFWSQPSICHATCTAQHRDTDSSSGLLPAALQSRGRTRRGSRPEAVWHPHSANSLPSMPPCSSSRCWRVFPSPRQPMLGVKPSTARVRLHRARARLRVDLHDLNPTPLRTEGIS